MDQEDAVPLSALQHWAYCPRQCGLIHLEQAFDDNVHTLRGQAVHKRVDQPGVETAKGVRTEHALPLWHDGLSLIGKADVVEFDKAGRPYPVEYKHGNRHKAADIAACDDLQLAAQALCLEAMTGFDVPEGAIYSRAALALDLMEEFRPFADRLALSLVNRAQIQATDFVVREGGGVSLTPDARKAVVVAFQERKQEEVQHPLFAQSLALGLVPLVQARLMARTIRREADFSGKLSGYLPFLVR
jgi:CRISPR-associated protein Cas4